jgi:endogenous inhibitor of DNA gyrase (YacG/DUF329 family)/regulator of replication initiation timing
VSDTRNRLSIGDHDGAHPFACDICQAIDLGAKEIDRIEARLREAEEEVKAWRQMAAGLAIAPESRVAPDGFKEWVKGIIHDAIEDEARVAELEQERESWDEDLEKVLKVTELEQQVETLERQNVLVWQENERLQAWGDDLKAQLEGAREDLANTTYEAVLRVDGENERLRAQVAEGAASVETDYQEIRRLHGEVERLREQVEQACGYANANKSVIPERDALRAENERLRETNTSIARANVQLEEAVERLRAELRLHDVNRLR